MKEAKQKTGRKKDYRKSEIHCSTDVVIKFRASNHMDSKDQPTVRIPPIISHRNNNSLMPWLLIQWWGFVISKAEAVISVAVISATAAVYHQIQMYEEPNYSVTGNGKCSYF
uniref:Uncharacterized protein n=1 Tax=Nelumbo nucifera TaxID=4432 RepID=A0A822XMS8_NELNU|nr:TPA_asm: hypothetical protein HUJ06_021528 [Nelumbo nucifera]